MTKAMHEPTYLILSSLLGEPLHGYAILGEVERLAATTLRIGTLYAALDRLAGEGLVEVASEEVVNGRLRRTYRITGAGERALTAETERLERLARQTRQRLRSRPALGFVAVARQGLVR